MKAASKVATPKKAASSTANVKKADVVASTAAAVSKEIEPEVLFKLLTYSLALFCIT
jgi:hypothetical protein